MANRESFVSNAAESTLSSSLASGATTINVTSTAAFPAVPFYAVIDPDVNASREIIYVDSAKTATTFALTAASSRGQDGTTDTSHSSGAKVVCVPIAALWADINDRVDASYNPGGTDVAVADGGTGASTAAGARTNLAVPADADVVKLTGDQTVAGIKTFSASPIVPAPTTDLQAATKKYVDDSDAGKGVRAWRSTDQSIPTSTQTAVLLNAETFDDAGFHDNVTNPSRITIPAGLGGLYRIAGQMFYSTGAGGISGNLRLNGTTFLAQAQAYGSTSGGTTVTVDTVERLVAGDYIEMTAFQSSGGTLSLFGADRTLTFLTVTRIGA